MEGKGIYFFFPYNITPIFALSNIQADPNHRNPTNG